MRPDKYSTELDNILGKSYEDIDIPDSLSPDNINIVSNAGEQYDQDDVPEFGDDTKTVSRGKSNIRKIGQYVAGMTAVAAAVACALISGKVLKNSDRLPVPDAPELINEVGDTQIASSYEEIYDIIRSEQKMINKDYVDGDMVYEIAEEAADDAAPVSPYTYTDNNTTGSSLSGKDYSDTNVQVEGVDEADIIKTDGEYIYYTAAYDSSEMTNFVYVSKAVEGKLEKVNKIHLKNKDGMLSVHDMYLYNNNLVVIGEKYAYDSGEANTVIWIYDVTNPYEANEVKKFVIDGAYRDSRCTDGYLYMFTDYYPFYGTIDGDKPKTYIPCVDGEILECNDIYISDKTSSDSFIIVTAINIPEADKSDSCKVTGKAAVLSSGGQLYVSTNSMYVLTNQYKTADNSFDEYTAITKFDYDNGKVEMKCTGRVKGFLDSQFSADEYKGHLRIVTTLRGNNRKDANALYVLDDKLEIVGSIGNIAKGERIYSARFYGDYGYFVTYYQTDPLFTVDLSNPKEPKIVSELKLPGFSDYLQGFGEDRLFGIGYDTDELDTDRYVTDVLKISMFNISDKENVVEENTLVLNDYEHSSACYDHKSLLINYDKNIIGFEARSWEDDGEAINYLVFRYEDNKFRQIGVIDYCDIMNVEEFNIYDLRGIYIGDYLYVISRSTGIASFELDGLKLVDTLRL